MYKKIIILPIIILFSIQGSYAADTFTSCETMEGYELYLCRVKSICTTSEYNPQNRVFNTEKTEYFYQENYNLYIAKNLYRENMNSIYKCAILKAQNNVFYIVKEKLKNAYSGVMDAKIATQQKRIERQINDLKCSKSESRDFNLKKQILDESTYEMCKYLTFLDYVRTTYINDVSLMIKDAEISKSVEEQIEIDPIEGRRQYLEIMRADEEYEYAKKDYSVSYILELDRKSRDEISEEIKHTKQVYKVAFQTYSNYENNLIIHVLLEMLENDFKLLRSKLYSALNPINQVVYKISNAMSQ